MSISTHGNIKSLQSNIVKIPCREGMVERINRILERLTDKNFNAIFNGNNFDIVDNKGKCLNYECGIDLNSLEEYSLLEHFFTIGDRVKITYARSKNELQEWYEDEEDYFMDGEIGIITEVCYGEAMGIGKCLLFDIEFEGTMCDCFIAGDFELV